MEQLLILNPLDTVKIRQRVESKARVVQEGSDKLLVIEGSAEEIQQATRIPGVVAAEAAAADVAEGLSPSEQVFLAAWRQRMSADEQAPRIGEGLSWGSKGFKAP